MKKLLKISFLISLLALTGAIFINSTWADTEEENFISGEKVLEILHNLPEVKAIEEKYHNLIGHGFGVGMRGWPSKEFPFYIMNVSVSKEIEKSIGVYEARDIFSQLYYIDAYIGEVYSEEAMQRKILAIKEAERLRKKQEAEQREKEKFFGVELKKRYAEITEKKFQDNPEYKNLIKESIPLFLRALNAVTPEIRFEGVRIISWLANLSESFGGYKAKEAIPNLVELLKDDDYGIRYEAVVALGNIGDKGNKDLIESILPLLKDPDSLVRRGAISALGKIGDNSLTPVFIDLLGDTSVNQETVRALAQIGDEQTAGPLSNLLGKNEYCYLERDTIYALGNTGGKKSIPILIGLLNREYSHDTKYGGHFEPRFPYMGLDTACVLAKIGKESIPYLLEALKSEDYLIRLYSTYTLSMIKAPVTLDSLNKALIKEKHPAVKMCIEQTLAETKGEKFIPKLKIWAKLSEQKYRFREAINTALYIQNIDSIPVFFNSAPFPADSVYMLFSVTGPGGRPAPLSLPQFPIIQDNIKIVYFPTKKSFITLNPGQSYRLGLFPIQEYFSFAKRGKYQIIGVYDNRFNGIEWGVYAWTGKLESQPINIDLE